MTTLRCGHCGAAHLGEDRERPDELICLVCRQRHARPAPGEDTEKLAGFRCTNCGSERGVAKGDRIVCLGCSKSVGAPPTFPSSPDAGPARWRAIVEIEAPSEAALARRLAGVGAAFSSSSAVHERELRVAGGVVRIERMSDDVASASN